MNDNKKSSINMMKQTFILTLVSAATLVVSFGKETIVAFFFGTSKVGTVFGIVLELIYSYCIARENEEESFIQNNETLLQ